MRDYFKLKTWLISFVIFYLSISLGIAIFCANINLESNIALASSGDNVHGFAWSDLYGWISFNSTNCDADCVGPVCTSDGSPNGCLSAGTNYRDYGVKLESGTGNFSGYAWSSNFGWIYFGPNATLNGYGLTQAGDAPSDPKIWAHYDSGTKDITGWAKVLALGNDGWIKMKSDTTDPGYASKAFGVKINTVSNELEGWAWNGNVDKSGVGWISFNCNDPGAVGCGGSTNYKVAISGLNTPPSATNLTALHNSNNLICNNGASEKEIKLNWEYQDTEDFSNNIFVPSAYQVIIDTFDTGKVFGPALAYTASALSYNTTYNWWVKVWDSQDVPSILTPGLSFTTYAHDFPNVNFSSIPPKPSKNEEFRLTGSGSRYLTSDPTSPVDCTINPDEDACKWRWTLPVGVTVVEGDINASSTIIVTSANAGSQTVLLNMTDPEGYSCTSTQIINLNASLPKWKEVK